MIYSLGRGGAERATIRLARGLCDAGHAVDVVVARAEGPLVDAVPADARLVDLRAGSARAWLRHLVAYLRRERPQALLAVMEGAGTIALAARKLARSDVRVVVVNQNTLSRHTPRSSRWKERHLLEPAVRRLYPQADGIVAASDGAADDLAAVGRIPRTRITVIHNPVVPEDALAGAREPIHHPWFTAGQPPVVVAAGRLTEQKDFPTLLRAFKTARAARPLRLVILGEGEERTRLEQMAHELGVAADVELPGYVANPYSYMARASLFVVSSAWEGFSNALVEALACGAAIVSTDCPSGPAEILDEGRYGRLVPVGDPAALADAMLTTLDEEPERDRLRSRAREFSLETALERYETVLGL
jgi:glycosyltransferase involved in cell wall biosynthesis